MKLKRYRAPDMRQALAEVRAELGDNALIIATRQIPGLVGTRGVEVTAAIEEKQEPAPIMQVAKAESESVELKIASLQNEIRSLRGNMRRRPPAPVQTTVQTTPVQDTPKEDLQRELEELRRYLFAFSSHLPTASADRLLAVLRAADVEGPLAQALADMARTRLEDAVQPTDEDARAALAASVAAVFKEPSPKAGAKLTVVVGPTGVGKTTTIAKLAARASLIEGKRVGLITTDTYRVGAVDQLRQYAELIGVPLQVVREAAIFEKAMAAYADLDCVFMDTAGRSPADVAEITWLRALLASDGETAQVHLVVEAATRQLELRHILNRFLPLAPSALLFTKLDEAHVFGALVNGCAQTSLPMSYVTMGQRVPEDIDAAEPRALARQIVERGWGAAQALETIQRRATMTQDLRSARWA